MLNCKAFLDLSNGSSVAELQILVYISLFRHETQKRFVSRVDIIQSIPYFMFDRCLGLRKYAYQLALIVTAPPTGKRKYVCRINCEYSKTHKKSQVCPTGLNSFQHINCIMPNICCTATYGQLKKP